MKPIDIKIARRIIAGKGYIYRRMERMNSETVYWIEVARQSNCTLRRRTCLQMAEIYNRRYNHYLKKTQDEYRKSDADCPRGARAVA